MKEQEVILTEDDLKGLNESNDGEGGWGVPEEELKKKAKSVKKDDGIALWLWHIKNKHSGNFGERAECLFNTKRKSALIGLSISIIHDLIKSVFSRKSSPKL